MAITSTTSTIKYGTPVNAQDRQLRGAEALAAKYGDVDYNRSAIEGIFNNATNAEYATKRKENKNTELLYAKKVSQNQNAYLDAMRRQYASNAVQSGANQGMQAANQLSAMMGMNEMSSMDASKQAQAYQLLADKEAQARTANAKTALEYSNAQKMALGTLDSNLYSVDAQKYAAELAANAQVGVANTAASAQGYAADQGLAGTRYNADQNLRSNQYVADQGLAGTRYASDQNLIGNRYTADQNLAGSRYNADKNYAGNVYNADQNYKGVALTSQNNLEGQRYASDKSYSATQYNADKNLEGVKYTSDGYRSTTGGTTGGSYASYTPTSSYKPAASAPAPAPARVAAPVVTSVTVKPPVVKAATGATKKTLLPTTKKPIRLLPTTW